MRTVSAHVGSVAAAVVVWGVSAAGSAGGEAAPALHAGLRNATASACFDPESHLRLARYHYDAGHGVQAVYLAEYARVLFGDRVFLPSFNDFAAVRLLEPRGFSDEVERAAFCREHPNAPEAYVRDLEGVLGKKDLRAETAEELLQVAFARYPHHLALTSLAAAYYARTRKDLGRALPFYVDLYFHDPRFDDGKGAAARIAEIGAALRATWWAARKRSGAPLELLVAEEENPEVLRAFLAEAQQGWNASLAGPVLALLEKDDPALQVRALAVLVEHPADVAIERTAKAMLASDDLVKRALAPFLVVSGLGEKAYPLLDGALDSGVQLVQANAIQTLAQMGGASGAAYLRQHPPQRGDVHVRQVWREAVERCSGAATNRLPTARWSP